MKWIQPSLYFAVFSLPLCLNLVPLSASTVQVQAHSHRTEKTWQISQAFKPPKRGDPPASSGGSTRGSSCLTGNKSLTALIPANKLGLTFAKHPTFFWYVPTSEVKTAKFIILDRKERKSLYQTTLPLPRNPGIMSFTLPESAPPLAVGKTYYWYFTIVCNSEDESENPSVDGWVERTQPELSLSQALAKADLRKQPTLYAEAGIWHEALITLVQLRRSEPNNLKTRLDWKQLFTSVGLSAIAPEPLLDCCKAQK
ncbi:DUF928 domain-containing protein [Nostocaceae cyanobacterium CENA369]|uniref:DUF928 domain-containing protein n=1 Tax=Dendronalium phyllosphericum CENA369 TaxID=1725256 RepID=A0A8J7I4F0_9NOST|nr:DUF928 domain-containing protein [Dendronalium phyllosphericum]MBH8574480.1 DUF928 domain-containing protein [Dendronalium phyllosphericum CENA369]